MSMLIRAVALWLLVAALVWLVSLWRWQTTGLAVGGDEIVRQLLVLPVVLAAVLLLFVWGVGRLRKASQPASPAVPGVAVAAPDASPSAAPPVHAVILSSAVHLRVGDTPADALSVLREEAPRPGLDASLADVEGLPVYSARVAEIDAQAAQVMASATWREGLARSMALLAGPCDRLLARAGEAAAQWLDASRSTSPAGNLSDTRQGRAEITTRAHLSGLSPPRGATKGPVLPARLHVDLLVPRQWPAHEREQAAAWLQARCQQWLQATSAAEPLEPAVRVHAVAAGDAAWSSLDETMFGHGTAPAPRWGIVLVADSALDPSEVERRQGQGALFTSRHQSGRMLGEGAAGLLWCSPAWPRLEALEPCALMSTPTHQHRDKSADAPGRVGPQTLTEVARASLHKDGCGVERIGLVVTDADHRASRTGEVFEAVHALRPDLDPMTSVIRLGEACADLGLAAVLAPVALAVGHVHANGQAALALNVQDPYERTAITLIPWQSVPTAAGTTS